ncbi:MAG TPA: CoA pyrophosphatase [Gemmatimonadaceae bacterium]|nr:CoA pyrophosphatase [Gemmatimonadaceae bacterium]
MSFRDHFPTDPRIARLESALAARTPIEVHDPVARRAAVAILIRFGQGDEPEIFFIQRAEYEGDPWSGHIAFPGGREEAADESLLETAIRETFEETGIDLRGSADLLGVLHDLRPVSVKLPEVMVRPYVFVGREIPEPVLSSEVAGAFWVPLAALLDTSVWKDTMVRAGEVEINRRAFHHEGNIVWGITERILSDLLGLIEP